MTTYFYMRISTKESTDKQSYDRQRKALETYAKNNNLKFDNRTVYKDDVTGATFNRPDWLALSGTGKEENGKINNGVLQEGDTIVFKEISRFTRQAEEGYKRYMQLMENGINLIFLDNPTVSTDYIKQLTNIANNQQLVTRTALESTIKLLLIVELDRVQQEREIISKRIKQGIAASSKPSGRKKGQLDKMNPDLESDIKEFLVNRSIKQTDLMKKYNISRNTLKKYIKVVESAKDNK